MTTYETIALPQDITVKNGDTIAFDYTINLGTSTTPSGIFTMPTATSASSLGVTFGSISSGTTTLFPKGWTFTPTPRWGNVSPEIKRALDEALEECRGLREHDE